MPLNQRIPKAHNIQIELISDLDDWDGVTGPVDRDLRQVVVQKTYVGQNHAYALQQVGGASFVYRGRKERNVSFKKSWPILRIAQKVAGHTQTFENAGRKKQWFVGVKPNDMNQQQGWSSWSSQIARLKLPRFRPLTNLRRVPCLTNLNHAGNKFGISCASNQFARVELAVSTDQQDALIAYGDNDHNGYFALYQLNELNAALDQAKAPNKAVDITQLNCLDAFMIPNLSGSRGQVGSLQGFALNHYFDQSGKEQNDLYISSQPASDKVGHDRKIVKIPWREPNPLNWELVDLTEQPALEIPGYYTELEGLQLISNNEVYLTVAYHQQFLAKNPTKINKLYRVTWKSNN
ncbi:bacteriocin [Lactobacillus sp. ESL0263]|uniref:helveticin J family class III bacteriocin n=1 Tax=Lactobacillus sp. ESL0263 TaxID=2069350 RepID=UPI000EFC9899|nr:helveticin J family class III bacteriocin [Lactobacillus sp. ESL0263]RMC51415.1 bacteriocin [Lactobacillus sp. ESL0263]